MFSAEYVLVHGKKVDAEKVRLVDADTSEVFEVQRLTRFSTANTLRGEDTYCLVRGLGAMHYGGVSQWSCTATELTLHLSGSAARELGVSSPARFTCAPGDLAEVQEHLVRLLAMPPARTGEGGATDPPATQNMIKVSWVDDEELTFRALVIRDEEADDAFQIQRSYTFDDQDVRSGMDTYCLVHQTATHYGGVQSYRLEGTRLHMSLAPKAARDLWMEPEFELGLGPAGAELFSRHIDTLLAP